MKVIDTKDIKMKNKLALRYTLSPVESKVIAAENIRLIIDIKIKDAVNSIIIPP